MSLRDSRDSIKFLQAVYKYLVFLSVAPSYDFDKNDIVYRKRYKCYCLSLVLISMALLSNYLYDSWVNNIQLFTSFFSFLRFINLCTIQVLSAITVLGSGYWNMDNWKYLLSQFFHLEKQLRPTTFVEKSVLKNFYFHFFLSNFWIILITLFVLIVWILPGSTHHSLFMLEVYNLILVYVKHMKALAIYNIVLAIKCKYQHLNKLLVTGCLNGTIETIKNVKRVSYLYEKINELVNTFNRLFGWEILLGILHSSILILLCFSHIHTYYASPMKEDTDSSTFLVVSMIVIMISTLVGPTLIMFSCDEAVKEAKNIVPTCYKIQHAFPIYTHENQALVNLANQAIINRPSFNAAGFLEINRTTLFALLGTSTTYFIVVIQFNQM